MSLKARLSEEMKAAMKSGNKDLLAAVRNLHAAVRKKEIDDRVDIDDAGFVKIVMASAKQRQDSIEQFTAGNRLDLVEKEKAELTFLQSFLPQQMSKEEVEKLVVASIQEANATTQKDMGAVMKVLMPKVSGRADGKLVNQIVREKLPQ